MINRFKVTNPIAVMPHNEGNYVLYDEATEMLEKFVGLAIKAGADEDLLLSLIEGGNDEKVIIS